MEQRCLLAAFAHPDDEAFGTAGVFRKYRDEGARTALVCATRGEEGEISDPALATPQTLGQVREQELREACRIIGVEDLSFLDYRDGSLAQADPTEATGRLVRQIRRVRPQVVVTFDANGGYGHRDHMAIHRLTVAAFQQAGDPACFPEQLAEGLRPYAPQKLFFTAFARSVMRTMREALQQAGGANFRPGGNAATIPLEQMGTPDELITTAITLDERQLDAKVRAMRAHRTQMNPHNPINRLSPDATRAWLGTERFVRAYPPGAPRAGGEHDLFAGVRLDG